MGDWRPWLAGAMSGNLLTLVGHPFDTAKTRLQADNTRFTSPLQCVRQTIQQEGALALYKGLLPALLTSCVTSGLRFGVQHRINGWLAARLREKSETSGKASFAQLPLRSRVLAEGGGGAACGAVLPLVFTPMELVKVKRQVMRDNQVTNMQVARSVYREHGLRGMYTGYWLTVVRSTVGNATMFGTFEIFRAMFIALGWAEDDISGHMLSGLLSGVASWLVTFPVDAAKSRQQLQVQSRAPPLSAAATLRELAREGALYRGLSPVVIRSMPVHLVYLPSYSFFMRVSERKRGHEQ